MSSRLLWVNYIHAAQTDLSAALHDDEANAAAHLRDALANIQQAIDAIEEGE